MGALRKNVRLREKIIITLVNAVVAHYNDVSIKNNSCNTLDYFKIPEEIVNRIVVARTNTRKRRR